MRIGLLLLLLAHGLSAKPPKEPMDEAIERGLLFLRRTQDPNDGSWTGAATDAEKRPVLRADGAGGAPDPAVTSLAVMAFLSAGHVPGEGRHGAAIEKGIRYVLGCQKRNGLIGNSGGGITEMYHHGICTLMLAEAAGMTRGDVADDIKAKLEKAVAAILAGQRPGTRGDGGGWRYQVTGTDSDLSVTGWQLMALRGAKNLGCDIPKDRVDAAVAYVLRCHDKSTGGFRYMPQNSVTVACTGTGILALELCGREHHLSKEVKQAGDYILEHPLDPAKAHFYYGVYYTSQGMFQLGGDYWKRYRPQLHQLLLKDNPPRADGSWKAGSSQARDDLAWGPNYCTSMAVLALTVEYRYLPIYQRFEEPVEKD